MHWLTKYTNKKCHAHGDMHSIQWPHYSSTILASSPIHASCCVRVVKNWAGMRLQPSLISISGIGLVSVLLIVIHTLKQHFSTIIISPTHAPWL